MMEYARVSCPDCRGKALVVRTMPWAHGRRRRYHKCQECGHAFTTTEYRDREVESDG